MSVPPVGISSVQALFYQAQCERAGCADAGRDREGSGTLDQVSLSLQAQFLGGQVQLGPTPFKDLAQSLLSGDVAGAQKAFAAVQQHLQARSPSPAANPGGASGSFSQDLAALGQALQAGDLDAAKQAFATLQQDAQALGAHHRHRHHHHGGQAQAPANGTGSGQAGANLLSLSYTSISITLSDSGSGPNANPPSTAG